MKKIVVMLAIFFWATIPLYARKLCLATDILGYACLGTLNVDLSYSVSQKWTLDVGFRYNPFTFNQGNPDKQFQIRQRSVHLGARLWPWHTGSGWWFAGKIRGQEYNWGGILSRVTEEGMRVGAGLGLGYTHMLSPHFNIEFGAGIWGGYESFRKYSCPVCGVTVESGYGAFIAPYPISVSLVYVF